MLDRQTEENKPLLVEHPTKPFFIDIRSLFNFMDTTFGCIGTDIAGEIDSCIRIISMSIHNEMDMGKVHAALYNLYELRDAFNQITIFSNVKKGAAK